MHSKFMMMNSKYDLFLWLCLLVFLSYSISLCASFSSQVARRYFCEDPLCSLCAWTKPLSSSFLLGTLADLGPSKSELRAENALLREQLIMLKRQVKRPVCSKADRILLVLLARVVRAWKQALLIVQPETLAALASWGISPLWEAVT